MLEDEDREDNGAQPAEGAADGEMEPDVGGEMEGGEKPTGDGLTEDAARPPDENASHGEAVDY